MDRLPHLDQSTAALRIKGDDLDPDEISRILGCEPSYSCRKGQIDIGKKTGQKIERKGGLWLLNAEDRTPENLDSQIRELLGKLPSDLNIWRALGAKYEFDLSCGLFMNATNEGFSISSANLIALGARGIQLDLEIFAPTDSRGDELA
jgi:hypothetical protein